MRGYPLGEGGVPLDIRHDSILLGAIATWLDFDDSDDYLKAMGHIGPAILKRALY